MMGSSPSSSTGALIAWPGFQMQLQRAVLSAQQNGALTQDLLDAAELALAGDMRATAATLYGVVALERGASAQTFALLYEANRAFGWWEVANEQAASPCGNAIDIAADELRALVGLRPVLAPPPTDLTIALCTLPQVPTAVTPEIVPNSTELMRRVIDMLQLMPAALRQGTLYRELAPLADELRLLDAQLIEAHVHLPVAELAAMLALERVRLFVVRNWELLTAVPQPALVDAAARLNPAGLGPYFSNVRMLLRTRQDFLAQIEAVLDEDGHPDQLECWALLLSSHLGPGEIADLTEELGDRAMLRALRGLLFRIVRTGQAGDAIEAVRRLRDAGLDLGDVALAAEAQCLIVQRSSTDATEWQLLGSIQATMGAHEKAECSLSHALFLRPDDETTRVRLALLKLGRPFLIESGLKSSAATRQLRLARSRSDDGELL